MEVIYNRVVSDNILTASSSPEVFM